MSSLVSREFFSMFRELRSMLLKIAIMIACRSSFVTFPFDFSEGVGLSVKIGHCKSSGRFAMLDLGVYRGGFCFAPHLKVCSLLRLLGIQDLVPRGVPKLCSSWKFRMVAFLARAHSSPRSWHFGWLSGSCLL